MQVKIEGRLNRTEHALVKEALLCAGLLERNQIVLPAPYRLTRPADDKTAQVVGHMMKDQTGYTLTRIAGAIWVLGTLRGLLDKERREYAAKQGVLPIPPMLASDTPGPTGVSHENAALVLQAQQRTPEELPAGTEITPEIILKVGGVPFFADGTGEEACAMILDIRERQIRKVDEAVATLKELERRLKILTPLVLHFSTDGLPVIDAPEEEEAA